MAPIPLSSLSPSDRDVWLGSHLSVHLTASVASRDDARRLDALAKYNGYERRHRNSGRRDDPAGRPWAVPPGAPADHDSGGIDWRLAVLCPTPVRGHLLVA